MRRYVFIFAYVLFSSIVCATVLNAEDVWTPAQLHIDTEGVSLAVHHLLLYRVEGSFDVVFQVQNSSGSYELHLIDAKMNPYPNDNDGVGGWFGADLLRIPKLQIPGGDFFLGICCKIFQYPGKNIRFKLSKIWKTPASWIYWINNPQTYGLTKVKADVIVTDYSKDGTKAGSFTKQEITEIKNATGAQVWAYLSIGEAEDYRWYWKHEWEKHPPQWLGSENDSWRGNYKVRYWESEWKEIIFACIDQIMKAGFDGLYLDIVDAWEYWEQRKKEGWYVPVDPASEMALFIHEIRQKSPEIFIVPQNGEGIVEVLSASQKEQFLADISAVAIEDLFYEPGCMPAGGSSGRTILLKSHYLSAGLPVLVVDYIKDQWCESDFKTLAQRNGFVPLAAMPDRELDEAH